MKRLCFVVAIVAMVASAAFAADAGKVTPNINQGTMVLEGSGSVDGDTPVGTDVTLQLGFGYFIMDGLEVGAVGGFQDNDLFQIYDLGARAEYNFDLGIPVVPFVGAGVLWVGAEADATDKSQDTAVGRLEAGVKWFISNDVALTFNGVYDKAADDVYFDEDGEANDDNVKGLFGIRFYFD